MTRSAGIAVDADVARAASDGSEAVRAVACARAMAAIHASGSLYLVFEARLLGEWHLHRSGFARKWLVSMYARKRVRNVSVAAWKALRAAIEALPSRARAAAEKDLHLVELARYDGWRLVSLDDTARQAFIQACSGCTELKQLAWANPMLQDTVPWLEGGAREAGPRLGSESSTPRRSRRRQGS